MELGIETKEQSLKNRLTTERTYMHCHVQDNKPSHSTEYKSNHTGHSPGHAEENTEHCPGKKLNRTTSTGRSQSQKRNKHQ